MHIKTLLTTITIIVLLGSIVSSCENHDLDHNYQEEDKEDVQEEEKEEDNNEDEESPAQKSSEFVILFTNDFHSQIEPTGKNETYNADRGGIKRIKVLVDSVRAAEPAVLLADAGDLVQGTYYFSLLNGVVEMKILEELDYDVRTLGNHEFDKKMVGLGEMLALSTVPVVASNYDFSRTSIAGQVKKSAILDAGGIKVGFIGLNIMLKNLVDPTAYVGVEWQNAINVADIEAEKLREQGADIVIALSHLGYRESDSYYYDRGIALNTRHIDMIIGGHTHTFLNKPDYVTNLDGDKVPVVQTGSRGICLGYAKIRIDDKGKPSFTYKLIPVKNHLDKKIDNEFSDIIDAYSATVAEKMNEVVGYCPRTLRKGNPESPLGNLTADGLIWMAKEYYDVDADVSIYNSGGIRAEISAGDVTLGDVYATYPFDNVLTFLKMKGDDLMNLFDNIASYGGVPINSAVRLRIRDGKVSSVLIDGKEIEKDREYTIATIDYLANTGEYGLDKGRDRVDSAEFIRDHFGDYFRYIASCNGGKITADKDGRIIIE